MGEPYRWKKGCPSPNPGGRTRKTKLTDAYRDWLEEVDPKTGLTNAERIAVGLGNKALKGDTIAAREIADRTEGKARQPIEMLSKVEIKGVLIDRSVRPPKPKKDLGNQLLHSL